MTPRVAHLLGLDWANPCSPRRAVRWASSVALVVSGLLVLLGGLVQLMRAELKRIPRGRKRLAAARVRNCARCDRPVFSSDSDSEGGSR